MISFDLIRRSLLVSEVLFQVGWCSKRRPAGNWRGPCPLRQGHTVGQDEFSLSADRQHWYCHKCRKGGDVIDLVAVMDGLTILQAARKIAEIYHVGLVPRNGEEERS